MTVSAPDIHQTLEYRPTAEIVRLLPTGLLLIFLGLFLYAILDPDREPATTFLGIGACFVMGIAVIGIALWNRYDHGRPLFALSPAGIHYRIPWVKELLIPWREVKGIDSIDIQTGGLVDELVDKDAAIRRHHLSRRHRGPGAEAAL
jgi:hypothetical protein